eukprot:gnl/Dysnectes_brevis/8041_a14041_276.p1 GENE.gnl/Dysnectes_brevis/8041_a14041_276~~gnl/Dysnectes_brevis/8041_a14041_276.p1  ORF type:complete len:365 (+),score=43.82 gnl/Dysnectes_brevis/8041_a14041_276:94-1188(+)
MSSSLTSLSNLRSKLLLVIQSSAQKAADIESNPTDIEGESSYNASIIEENMDLKSELLTSKFQKDMMEDRLSKIELLFQSMELFMIQCTHQQDITTEQLGSVQRLQHTLVSNYREVIQSIQTSQLKAEKLEKEALRLKKLCIPALSRNAAAAMRTELLEAELSRLKVKSAHKPSPQPLLTAHIVNTLTEAARAAMDAQDAATRAGPVVQRLAMRVADLRARLVTAHAHRLRAESQAAAGRSAMEQVREMAARGPGADVGELTGRVAVLEADRDRWRTRALLGEEELRSVRDTRPTVSHSFPQSVDRQTTPANSHPVPSISHPVPSRSSNQSGGFSFLHSIPTRGRQTCEAKPPARKRLKYTLDL